MKKTKAMKTARVVVKTPRSSFSGPPVAVSTNSRVSMPRYSSGSSGGIVISRTEFVSTLGFSTSGFSVHPLSQATPGLDLNPGSSYLFPWLNVLARNYEKFRFTKLAFRLIPAQGTTVNGRYYFAIDYDYDDAVATTKVALMSNRTVQEAPVWQPMRIVADPAQLHSECKFKYVSSVTRPNFVEPRTAYCGFLLFACDSSTLCSFDLEVEYTVELTCPCLEDSFIGDTWGAGTALESTLPVINTLRQSGWYGVDPINSLTSVGNLAPSRPVLPPILKYATVGQDQTPVMFYSGNSDYGAPPQVLDVGSVPFKGALSVISEVTNSTLSPANWIDTKVLQPYEGHVWDSTGKFLGNLSTVTSGTIRSVSNKLGVPTSTVEGAVSVMGKWAMSALMTKFPTARYVLPLILTSATVAATSKIKTGFMYEP